MSGDQKQVERLTRRWERADALWKKASTKSHDAIAAYRWTVLDDGSKWNRVLAMRMRETIAFKKAEAAHQMLADFIPKTHNP